ncbi:uncharacterized protein Z518_02356 [Rhinocladiella mackenziei CBS 650.93]|uniref:Uncharacterized protein n=1 Tax=Rhinocladiella mackenziei CBS 650.93 TaxID=1442369 RepID=A0A0D2FZH8_9EURO|nr:uncharacterized protein Z518_02356 [Rhinocladiella mackenziei CBS 650.93]KIX07702.1 hypothetical protein Z518_02356 [Rhinocladiella mackenziei CBS 650.93]
MGTQTVSSILVPGSTSPTRSVERLKFPPHWKLMKNSQACTFVRFLCEQAGVEFVLGDPQSKVQSLVIEGAGPSKRVTGVKMCDGRSHSGDIVIIVLRGPWTASIIPEAHRTVEATAGTVMFMDIPKARKDIWEKFSPQNFPVWSYRRGEGEYYQGGGFPITKEGRLKFGFLGRKIADYAGIQTPSGMTTSSLTMILAIKTLFLSAGDGHGFKFLLNLGKYVKNQLERVPDQFTQLWKWRAVGEGKESNGIGQGENGPREMSKFQMADPKDFKFQKARSSIIFLSTYMFAANTSQRSRSTDSE